MPGWGGGGDPGRGKDVFEVAESHTLELRRSESDPLMGAYRDLYLILGPREGSIRASDSDQRSSRVRDSVASKTSFPRPGSLSPTQACPGDAWDAFRAVYGRVWAVYDSVWKICELSYVI